MKDDAMPEPNKRKTAEDDILKQMRRIRDGLDPKVQNSMQEFAQQHANQQQAAEKQPRPAKPIVKKPAVKSKAKTDAKPATISETAAPAALPEGMVPYDKENAMQAVGQFIAANKHDQEFMSKVLKLFQKK